MSLGQRLQNEIADLESQHELLRALRQDFHEHQTQAISTTKADELISYWGDVVFAHNKLERALLESCQASDAVLTEFDDNIEAMMSEIALWDLQVRSPSDKPISTILPTIDTWMMAHGSLAGHRLILDQSRS